MLPLLYTNNIIDSLLKFSLQILSSRPSAALQKIGPTASPPVNPLTSLCFFPIIVPTF